MYFCLYLTADSHTCTCVVKPVVKVSNRLTALTPTDTQLIIAQVWLSPGRQTGRPSGDNYGRFFL